MNKLLSYFLKHISSICIQHLGEIGMSVGSPEKLALIDFTATFNIHSFIDYYIVNYGEDLGLEGVIEISDEFKAKWKEHYIENVAPLFKKGLELRRQMMGYTTDAAKEEEAPSYIT